MKLKHKNGRSYYKKTLISTMTLAEGLSNIPFYTKGELTDSERNYKDEGNPYKDSKGGEIKSMYLLYIPEAYGALKIHPSKEAIIDGYAKLVQSGVLIVKHDTDLIEETPLSELLAPAPILFPSELKDVTSTYKDFIPPMNVIQPSTQSVHMKASNQLLITYDKPLYIGRDAALDIQINLLGGVKIPAALVGHKLSLRIVSKVFTTEAPEVVSK
jgi:hypothetical protein